MKYYIKDDTVYIKYISALDGKLKTLEFNVNDDKEFLKNLFKEKKEETQIFMLDDTIREKEHPTNEDMEYTTILTLKKPDKENEKQLNFAFYRSKVEEQERIIKDISEKLKTPLTDDDKKKLQTELSNAEKRKEYYENEMKKSIKTTDDVIKKPKSEEILALEKLLKGNLKDSNEEAKQMIINILKGKGLSDEQIKDLMDSSKNFKDVLTKITLTPEEKNNIVNDIKNLLLYYNTIENSLSKIYFGKIPSYFDLDDDFINILKAIIGIFENVVYDATNQQNVLIFNPNYALSDTLKKNKIERFNNNDRDKSYKIYKGEGKIINNNSYDYLTIGSERREDYHITIENLDKILKNIGEFLRVYETKIKKGLGLKDKIKSSITSDVDKKLDTLIKQFEILKNDYINFKELMKKSKEEPKKEIEIIKNETIKEEPKKEPDFLDMIKNFSKNKLRHQEIIKQEPKEEKSKLEETFEKRRKDIEMSDDEEDDDLEWLD